MHCNLLLGLRLLVLLILAISTDACTMILVGSKATTSGHAYAIHTDDAGYGASDYRLVKVPAMHYPTNTTRPVYAYANGYPRVVSEDRGPAYKPRPGQNLSVPVGYIPQPAGTTYAYLESDYGVQNEVQLSIAESTTTARTAGWALNDGGKCMMGIDALARLAMERCDSARCAVELMGELGEKYGFYSADSGDKNNPDYGDAGEALGLADKYGELWIFNIITGLDGKGAIWAAQRLDDDVVHVNGNDLTIGVVDLGNPDRFLGTENMVEIATEQGWYDKSEGPFDFTKVFRDTGGAGEYEWRRQWRVYSIIAPSRNFNPEATDFPVAVKPDKLLSLEHDIFRILRDSYQGTPYDLSVGIGSGPFGSPIRYDVDPTVTKYTNGTWERAISIFRGLFSFVAVVRPELPDPIGAQIWFGWDVPAGTVYHPIYVSATKMPDGYDVYGMQSVYEESPWRAYNVINNWANLRWDYINTEVQKVASVWEQKSLELASAADAAALKAWGSGTLAGRAAAVEVLTSFSTNHANALNADWWKLSRTLMAKYANNYILTGEGSSDWKQLGYPDWWLAATEYVAFPNAAKLKMPYKSLACAPPTVENDHEWEVRLSSRQVAMVGAAVLLSWVLIGCLVGKVVWRLCVWRCMEVAWSGQRQATYEESPGLTSGLLLSTRSRP